MLETDPIRTTWPSAESKIQIVGSPRPLPKDEDRVLMAAFLATLERMCSAVVGPVGAVIGAAVGALRMPGSDPSPALQEPLQSAAPPSGRPQVEAETLTLAFGREPKDDSHV